MSSLSEGDKIKIQNYVEAFNGPGYVLRFSNKEFREFIYKVANITIDNGNYDALGTSKGKRLSSLLANENDELVEKILLELIEYNESLASEFRCYDKGVKSEEIREIANKLLKNSPPKYSQPKVEPYFDNIKENIIKKIKEAEFTIWAVVAWITDEGVFKTLLSKKEEGVNVQLIMVDDSINKMAPFEFNSFEHYKIPNWGKEEKKYNKIHNKFCIIDFEIVITGSFNWTKTASNNSEDIVVIESREDAIKYSRRFMKIKREMGLRLQEKQDMIDTKYPDEF